MNNKKNPTVTIAAIGDLHMYEGSRGAYKTIFEEVSQKADVLVLCGDLTDRGLPTEAEALAEELKACKIPIVGVLGNHDYDSGKAGEVKKILRQQNMKILEEEEFEVNGVGFVGTKGFGGGFEKYMLGPFGEPVIKEIVNEAVNEALRLENELTRLKTDRKVVVLHYSPIRQTVEGEALEIYPFLGSSRLVEPIDNQDASIVFHGHAHHGKPQGKTIKGIPVYNVAYPLLQKTSPKQPYALVDI